MGRGLQRPKGEHGKDADIDVPSLVWLKSFQVTMSLLTYPGNGQMV